MILCLILLYLLVQIITVTRVHHEASTYYNDRISKNKIFPKVYDFGIKYVPDYSKHNWLHVLMHSLVFIPPFLFGSRIAWQFIHLFLVIYFIRFIFISATILPRDRNCQDKKLYIDNLFLGHCYDKIFSGHFAAFFLMSILLLENGILSVPIMLLLNFAYAFIIIALRWHYTVDILVAVLVVLLTYQNKRLIMTLLK